MKKRTKIRRRKMRALGIKYVPITKTLVKEFLMRVIDDCYEKDWLDLQQRLTAAINSHLRRKTIDLCETL